MGVFFYLLNLSPATSCFLFVGGRGAVGMVGWNTFMCGKDLYLTIPGGHPSGSQQHWSEHSRSWVYGPRTPSHTLWFITTVIYKNTNIGNIITIILLMIMQSSQNNNIPIEYIMFQHSYIIKEKNYSSLKIKALKIKSNTYENPDVIIMLWTG